MKLRKASLFTEPEDEVAAFTVFPREPLDTSDAPYPLMTIEDRAARLNWLSDRHTARQEYQQIRAWIDEVNAGSGSSDVQTSHIHRVTFDDIPPDDVDTVSSAVKAGERPSALTNFYENVMSLARRPISMGETVPMHVAWDINRVAANSFPSIGMHVLRMSRAHAAQLVRDLPGVVVVPSSDVWLAGPLDRWTGRSSVAPSDEQLWNLRALRAKVRSSGMVALTGAGVRVALLEGSLAPANFEYPELNSAWFYKQIGAPLADAGMLEVVRRQFETRSELERVQNWCRKCAYVNCWFMDEFESADMSDRYAPEPDAVCIHLTPVRLEQSFAAASVDVFIQLVKYYDPDANQIVEPGEFEVPLHKHIKYRQERELRA